MYYSTPEKVIMAATLEELARLKAERIAKAREVTVVLQPAQYKEETDDYEARLRSALEKQKVARGWELLTVSDIADANSQLDSLVCKCIKELHITGHGNAGRQLVASTTDPKKDTTGVLQVRRRTHWFRADTYETQGMELFDFRNVPFCESCTITLRGCYTGSAEEGQRLYAEIRKKTKCKVIGYDTPTQVGYDRNSGLPGGTQGNPTPKEF